MKAVIEENKMSKKLIIFYATIILICIIAVIVAIYMQFTEGNSGGTIQEQPNNTTISENTLEKYKTEFNNLFENKINYLENNNYQIKQIDSEKEIIYVGYENNENKVNNYDLEVSIPYINIKSEKVNEFNKAIKDTFERKAKNILNNNNNNTIYTVKYTAYISNNILSLVIRSTLKENNNPQRDIIQTYNYDLKNQKECTVQEMIEMKGITKQQASNKIREEIQSVQATISELEKLGYNVYARDPESDIYSINNVTEYFLGEDNTIYIIFAYGNLNNTSEMDIVIM